MILPITLTTAGAAALINLWLAMRVGRVRGAEKVSIGDGGSAPLIAAMRAHANFAEYTPFVLILIGLIELALGSSLWLWLVAGVFLIGRVLHGLGMTGMKSGRAIGTATTFLALLGLGIVAIAIPYLTPDRIETQEVSNG